VSNPSIEVDPAAGHALAVSSDGRGLAAQTRIFLRPIGSGLPLGFFSFGIGMLLLACLAIGWIPVAEQTQVGMLLVSSSSRSN
jgi:hypothetical protein